MHRSNSAGDALRALQVEGGARERVDGPAHERPSHSLSSHCGPALASVASVASAASAGLQASLSHGPLPWASAQECPRAQARTRPRGRIIRILVCIHVWPARPNHTHTGVHTCMAREAESYAGGGSAALGAEAYAGINTPAHHVTDAAVSCAACVSYHARRGRIMRARACRRRVQHQHPSAGGRARRRRIRRRSQHPTLARGASALGTHPVCTRYQYVCILVCIHVRGAPGMHPVPRHPAPPRHVGGMRQEPHSLP